MTKSKAAREEHQKKFADLLTGLKATLSDQVKEVRLSTRLSESPACLVTDTFGMTPAFARMYRASGQAVPVGKRIVELNPKHPLIIGLQQAHKNRRRAILRSAETAELLYGAALLAEGGVPEDPAKFAGLLADRLARTVQDTPPQPVPPHPRSRVLHAERRQRVELVVAERDLGGGDVLLQMRHTRGCPDLRGISVTAR